MMVDEEGIGDIEVGQNSEIVGKSLELVDNKIVGKNSVSNKVGQEQVHDLLFGEKLSWQAIIYDLINTEQLDPWDVDISLLSQKYLGKLRELEEANFFVSSKVLMAASLLLRIKSDILLNQELPGLDDILFGRDERKKYSQERIELDEDIPELVPRTPLPRMRRVTLKELMLALGKAINTENRRIKKEIVLRQRAKEAEIVLPKNVFNLRKKIRDIYSKLRRILSDKKERLAFSELLKKHGENDKLSAFVSLLHLDTQQKLWLEQDGHFEEIWIMMKEMYEKKNRALLDHNIREVEKYWEDESDEEIGQESEEGLSEDSKIVGKSSGFTDTGFSHNEVESGMED